ncbi:hypothetical protein N9A28_01420 [Sulfurimonas sp.]|nr:hypothetical protein [Sulfurimonas sp.]
MTFEQQWIEYDYNPFILFDSRGKIKSLNSEAQFLIGVMSEKELYELATTYANVTFGFKTTFIELDPGRYKFFALTVGYENDDEIGLKLYQSPSFKLHNPKPTGDITNIYTLVDLCISTNSINTNITFTKEFDPTIPEIVIDANHFVKILNKIYSCYENSKKINTKIYYRVGEHIKFEDKKYSLFTIEVEGEEQDADQISQLKMFASKSEFFLDYKKHITINIPMITSN